MIRFAVCDDESNMTEYISNKLREYYPDECEIKQYTDSNILLEDSKHEFFDAYFLDIGMPQPDGFETAERIRNNDSRVKIIFVTEKEELAYKGYIYEAFRFVRKSKLNAELRETAKSLSKSLSASNEYLRFKDWTGEVLINIKTLKYFEADGHSLILHAQKEERIFNTMQELDERLRERGFIRIHKSYLVNFRFFYSLGSTSVKLLSGEELPVSRKRIPKVKSMISQFSQSRDRL